MIVDYLPKGLQSNRKQPCIRYGNHPSRPRSTIDGGKFAEEFAFVKFTKRHFGTVSSVKHNPKAALLDNEHIPRWLSSSEQYLTLTCPYDASMRKQVTSPV